MRSMIKTVVAATFLLSSVSMVGPVQALTLVAVDNAQFISFNRGSQFPSVQSETLGIGQRGGSRLTMKNIGKTTWVRGTYGLKFRAWGNQIGLGADDVTANWVQAGTPAITYLSSAYLSSDIAPGQTMDIPFFITAPREKGRYYLSWAMSQDGGVHLFEEPTSFYIVDVVDPVVTGISLIGYPPMNASATLDAGQSLQLVAQAIYSDGVVKRSDRAEDRSLFHWLIAQQAADHVVTVDNQGKVTALDRSGKNQVSVLIPDRLQGEISGLSASIDIAVIAPTLQDNAQIVGVETPVGTTFKSGETAKVVLSIKNTGTTSWKATGQTPSYYLGGVIPGTKDVASILDASRSETLAPGQTTRFTAYVTLPMTPGTYQYQWRMTRDDDGPSGAGPSSQFGDFAPSTPLVWTVATSATQSLVIRSINGPSTLTIGEQGTWKVIVEDPVTQQRSDLNVCVLWGNGDSNCLTPAGNNTYIVSYPYYPNVGGYRTVGTYKIVFSAVDPTIREANSDGRRAEQVTTVQVVDKKNSAPVVKQVSGPTVLKVGEKGTWYVKAVDPENEQLTYSVEWGDESDVTGLPAKISPLASQGISQTATFTHYYNRAGVFTPRFTITDPPGQSADTSASVTVKEAEQPTGSMKITVVNGDIRCIKAPCGVLTNAKVAVYALSGDTLGDFIGSSDTSGGAAGFYNIPVGSYVAYASAPNFNEAKGFFTIRSGVGGYLTIRLSEIRETLKCPPDCPDVIDDVFEPELPNSSLIQLQRTKGVYLIENGQKRPIRSRAVFNARGFDMSDVIVVTKADFDRYPTGPDLTTVGTALPPPPPQPTLPPASPQTLQEGALAKALNDKAVYRIEGGKRRPFLSGSVFEARGFYWSDIIVVNPSALEAYPLGDLITYQRLGDGFLIKSPRRPEVFWTESGQKRHIANERVFAAHAFRWQDIHVISEEEVASYQTGADMDR